MKRNPEETFGAQIKKSKFVEQLESNHDGINYEESWPRPALKVDPRKDAIEFQQIEVEDYTGDGSKHLLNQYNVKESSLIRMHGVTMEGNSVTCHVHNFFPYLYVAAPNGFKQDHLKAFQYAINDQMRMKTPKATETLVLNVETCLKSSIYGYQGENKSLFLKITVRLHQFVATCKRVLRDGFQVHTLGTVQNVNTFESNIPFTLRFMIDAQIQGSSWVGLPAGTYQIRNHDRQSACQLEVDIDFHHLVAHQPEGEWSKIAPLRILSFDIECAGRKGIFPEANVDPVIQIANIVTIQGQSKPIIQNVFTLNTCAHIVGIQTLCYEKEEEMLQKWSDFLRTVDADIIIGYNINGFDLPYLLDRAKTLKLDKFPFWGRVINSRTVAKDSQFSSKAFGTRNTKSINIEGRVQLDVLQLMQRDYKLRSYSLNSVSAHFLGEQKEDVHHSIITDLQNGTDETRRRWQSTV